MKLPLTLRAYREVMRVGELAAPLWYALRARRGKEDATRRGERFGFPSQARPRGALAWMHGASVGETVSLLRLIEDMTLRGISVLVTSGTKTSAEVLARRLPAGAVHQYIPFDAPRAMHRFVTAWQPDLLLIAESELWPNMLLEVAQRSIPIVLVNARMSDRSYARWSRAPRTIAAMLARIDQCIAQSEGDAARFRGLGARNVSVAGNLKFDIPAPPAHPAKLAAMSALVAGRPVWLAASTHSGEEEIVLAAHRQVQQAFPDLLTIIAPRHPERGEDVMVACQEAALRGARRSKGAEPTKDIDVYVADTIGELGLFFRLSPLVFMGGSLVEHGGQNPIEPGKLGVAILHGPHIHNFVETYAALDKAGGAIQIEGDQGLAHAVSTLLGDQATLREIGQSAAAIVADLAGATDRTLAAIAPYLAWADPGSG